MVIGWSLVMVASISPGPSPASAVAPARDVGSALKRGAFPWYDAATDDARTIRVAREPIPSTPSASSQWRWDAGRWIAVMGFAVAILALIGLLAWAYRRYGPTFDDGGSERMGQGPSSGRIEELPAGLRREFESSDPRAEAIRRRDLGDYGGAVVCLFAHQLLTLSRLGLVRLAPGRTGRQLLNASTDPALRDLARPTLRLFEAAYYGHLTPTADEFHAAWASAEAFDRRASAGVVA